MNELAMNIWHFAMQHVLWLAQI